MKLFCFSYAGGSTSMYYKWNQYISPGIQIVPIEYAGRGSRANENLYNSFSEMSEDIYNIIEKQLVKDKPSAFFGYSMGGLVAYELAHKLVENDFPCPSHIFIAAREAPGEDIIKINHLPDEEFIHEIYSYEGMPKEIVENNVLLNRFLPILRSDFKIHETYEFNKNEKGILESDITVLYGDKDSTIIQDNIFLWKNFTNKKCVFHKFNGKHFFINNCNNEIIDIIEKTLLYN